MVSQLNADYDPTSEHEQQRWLVGYQRSEIVVLDALNRDLEAEVKQLRRRLWWRTCCLWVTSVVAGLLLGLTLVDLSLPDDLLGQIAAYLQQLELGYPAAASGR